MIPAQNSSSSFSLAPTKCTICRTHDNATEVFSSTVCAGDLSAKLFSARRLPDKAHFRFVRCATCGLLRSDPAADAAKAGELYAMGSFSYGREIENIRQSYRYYLERAKRYLPATESLLEIGCGNGFFLDEAMDAGFAEVSGVEPSSDACAKASATVKDRIHCNTFDAALFEPASFDLICLFQVLDHLPDPLEILQSCLSLLKPGGMLLCIAHDAGAWSARMLGERSPIYDVEHTYLFDQSTLCLLAERSGFAVKELGAAANKYSIRYLASLLPLPLSWKPSMDSLLEKVHAQNLALTLRLGNLYLLAQRPSGGAL